MQINYLCTNACNKNKINTVHIILFKFWLKTLGLILYCNYLIYQILKTYQEAKIPTKSISKYIVHILPDFFMRLGINSDC